VQDYYDNLKDQDFGAFASLDIEDDDSDIVIDSDSFDSELDDELNDYVADITMQPSTSGTQSKSGKKKGSKKKRREERKKIRADRKSRLDEAVNITEQLRSARRNFPAETLSILEKVNNQIHRFVLDQTDIQEYHLASMPASVRGLCQLMAKRYHLVSKSRGKNRHKITILYRTQNTYVPNNWKSLPKEVTDTFGVSKPKLGPERSSRQTTPKTGRGAAVPRVGEVIGSTAKPISNTNIGHKMLQSMGWKSGEGLGSENNKGSVSAVEIVVRGKRTGLGIE
jgi:hypothetical protein